MMRFLRSKKRVMFPFFWWGKVNALAREKSYDQAYLSCEKRLQEKPQDWRKIQRIGMDLAEKSLWVEAERFLKLASQGVQDSGLLESRGDVLEKIYYSYIQEPWAIGRLEEAFECWRRSLELNPRNLSLQLRLGATLMVVGRIQEAQVIFTEFEKSRNKLRPELPKDLANVKTISCIPNGIGHITLLDYYTKMRELGMIPKDKVLLLVPKTSNKTNFSFLSYWEKWGLETIVDPQKIKRLQPTHQITDENLNAYSMIDGQVNLAYHAIAEVEKRWHQKGGNPLLRLNEEHQKKGWEILCKAGMRKSDWFVTLHVRESGYTGEGDQPPNQHRNSRIETYLQGVKRITEAGGWVVRIGDPTMTPLLPMDRVIDSTRMDSKPDWMDLFFCAENRFYLGTSSGPCMIPPCFGKKCALANYELLSGRPFYFGNIYIPKLLYDKKKGRKLTFREVLTSDTVYCFHSNFFVARGLEFIHNSSDEIDELVQEMLESSKGNLRYTQEEEFLQNKFNSLATSLGATYGTNSRLGRGFLERHKDLLGKDHEVERA
jgi:putative glycosyltransferase (TIGR04372 family)